MASQTGACQSTLREILHPKLLWVCVAGGVNRSTLKGCPPQLNIPLSLPKSPESLPPSVPASPTK
eukprot:360794-Chlamydomonas_euryale.AAC.14